MSTTATSAGPLLDLTRDLTAPRAVVFAAWTDPERLARWWGPRGFAMVSCEADARVGGAWRVSVRSPEGSEHTAYGVYREVVAPERLVFTHAWEGTEDGEPGHETLVTVTLTEAGTRTRMTFRQAIFSSPAARDAHEEGWAEAFELLIDFLATR